jgi:hypothetical protein
MSPICNLQVKVIDIKCESNVMCMAQSQKMFYEPLPEFGGVASPSTGGCRRNPGRDLTGRELSAIQTSTQPL